MKILRIIPFVFLLPLMTYATNDQSIPIKYPFFITVDATSVFGNPGTTQHINLWDGLGNTYVATNHWDNTTTLMAGLGIRSYQNSNIQVTNSIRYLPISGMQVSGDVWLLDSPQFDNIVYSYQVDSHLILFDNSISWTRYRFQPAVIIGLGSSRNKVHHYHESPVENTTESATSTYTSSQSVQFAYEVGVGFDFPYKNIVFEGAYRFISAGEGQLGLSPIQNTTERLSTGNLYYQTVSLGIKLYYEV